MAAPTYLKVTLKLMALYAGLMGAMTLMFHDAAEFLFAYNISDPLLARYWGGVLMAMAVFYLFLSTDPEKYRMFIWVGVFDLGIATITTIVNVAAGTIHWLQGISALFLNPVLIIVLLYGAAKEPEGKVVFVASDQEQKGHEQHRPEHAGTHHPLHGK